MCHNCLKILCWVGLSLTCPFCYFPLNGTQGPKIFPLICGSRLSWTSCHKLFFLPEYQPTNERTPNILQLRKSLRNTFIVRCKWMTPILTVYLTVWRKGLQIKGLVATWNLSPWGRNILCTHDCMQQTFTLPSLECAGGGTLCSVASITTRDCTVSKEF